MLAPLAMSCPRFSTYWAVCTMPDRSQLGSYSTVTWETRWAFQNNGNLNKIFEDRWHRADPYDLNSQWIPGKYPANRNNVGNSHSDYGPNSTFWMHNA